MLTEASPNLDIEKVIFSKSIETHFQPIVSVRRKEMIGVEALSRGVFDDKSLIPPLAMFAAAAARNRTLELDYACRTIALNNFLPLHRQNPNLILFLNCHISDDGHDAENMLEMVRSVGVDPRNVAIEVLESQIADPAHLKDLVSSYKQHSFLVVIDDVGVGYSNLSRIAHLKPDILKADLSLVRDIHREYHKQEIFKSVITLSEKIGGWVITEGVEAQDEAVTALKLGADIFQGYFFARPQRPENDTVGFQKDSLEKAAKQFKQLILNKIKVDYYRREERSSIVNRIASHLSRVSSANFEAQLREQVARYKVIESASVIGDDGLQFTETVSNIDDVKREKTIIFRPPVKGTDHTLKEYYYALKETRISIYESVPYVPLPSDQLCLTVSTFFKDANSQPFILCLHLKTEMD